MGVGLGICNIFVRLCIYVLNKNLIKEHIMREQMVWQYTRLEGKKGNVFHPDRKQNMLFITQDSISPTHTPGPSLDNKIAVT
jgi:hypothetical protein